MLTVTEGEFQKNFGRYQETALTEPVAIIHGGRQQTVLISADEYRRLTRRREVLRAGELSDAELESIATTEMAAAHCHLDQELLAR
jgi:PHD/YefM family antitoxin component YafN of YafNO toxin-antitoxin module